AQVRRKLDITAADGIQRFTNQVRIGTFGKLADSDIRSFPRGIQPKEFLYRECTYQLTIVAVRYLVQCPHGLTS
ncbi:hypothetical protein ACLKMY_41945, partial [Paraburkholderia mimosarum]|uniref:hypothetical protein n=1 Tax=Paraburkholderia mimosarum TaxID=312026 RepID=UPI0039C2EABE